MHLHFGFLGQFKFSQMARVPCSLSLISICISAVLDGNINVFSVLSARNVIEVGIISSSNVAFLSSLWTNFDNFLGDLWPQIKLKVHQISAHLVHRELRNTTFEREKHKPKLNFRTLLMCYFFSPSHFVKSTFSSDARFYDFRYLPLLSWLRNACNLFRKNCVLLCKKNYICVFAVS